MYIEKDWEFLIIPALITSHKATLDPKNLEFVFPLFAAKKG